MTDNKMTPEQFIREWLPEYEKRNKEYIGEPKPRQEGFNPKSAKEPFDKVYFPEALATYTDHIRKEERHDIEWQYSDLVEELKAIRKVTPESFKSLTEEDKTEGYYLASCDCGWWGSSALLEGGGAIADTGDHFDCTCPFCGSADIGEMNDPYQEVWDQACEEQRESCAKEATTRTNDEHTSIIVDKNSIFNAPAPEFKTTKE